MFYIVFHANLYVGTDSHIAENIVEMIPLNADNKDDAFAEFLDALFDGIAKDIEFESAMVMAEDEIPTEALALL
jgi:hypothetical protein